MSDNFHSAYCDLRHGKDKCSCEYTAKITKIAALEAENAQLRAENNRLRDAAQVVIDNWLIASNEELHAMVRGLSYAALLEKQP